jgi:hypothetical protein
MTRALTRTHFHSSRLLRILTDLACAHATPGVAFAEKLGLWVDYTDAITLCAVHNASPASAPAQCRNTPDSPSATAPDPNGASGPAAAVRDFARQRALLERAIASASLPALDLAEAALLASAAGPAGAAKADITAAFEPYRRHYLAQQRDMELKVPPLRVRAREALAQAAGPLQQLGALDAALDGILQERESRLLGALPLLLKTRFTQLLIGHDPLQPGAWLARFGQELQAVLLAELDLRLQPATGLIEALGSETTHTPCTV